METTKPSPQWADKHPDSRQSFRMIDVGAKPATARRAVAEGTIEMSRAAFEAIANRTNPKGDVLAMAEVAGILAAKRASDWLPLCHPLPLESVRVSCRLDSERASVRVACEARTFSKTGVEMEALCGVNGALLAIYDLSKAVDPVLTITDIRLCLKEGGKSGRWVHPQADLDPAVPAASQNVTDALQGLHASVITVSDRGAEAGAASDYDSSGPIISQRLIAMGAKVSRGLVPDDKGEIIRAIHRAIEEDSAELILLTGGTGLSPRDVTPESVAEVCDRMIPGIGERLRAEGAMHTPMSCLSRSTAGLIGRRLVIALPGSRGAVSEGMDVLAELLPHALQVARGGDHAHHVP